MTPQDLALLALTIVGALACAVGLCAVAVTLTRGALP
jgi:hypothetical protein